MIIKKTEFYFLNKLPNFNRFYTKKWSYHWNQYFDRYCLQYLNTHNCSSKVTGTICIRSLQIQGLIKYLLLFSVKQISMIQESTTSQNNINTTYKPNHGQYMYRTLRFNIITYLECIHSSCSVELIPVIRVVVRHYNTSSKPFQLPKNIVGQSTLMFSIACVIIVGWFQNVVVLMTDFVFSW